MNKILDVKHMSIRYDQWVVDDVTLSLYQGEVVGLLGRNGCGKSTLLKGIMGSFPKCQGEVYVFGNDYLAMNPKKRAQYLSMLTQRFDIMEGIHVYEMIELGAYVHSSFFRSWNHHERIHEIAENFHIQHLLNQEYTKLSEGQKQLVQLARLTIQNTPVILLDEPDSALDFDNRHMIFQLIRDMIESHEKAGMIVLHDPVFALMYCDRILLMDQGRVINEIQPRHETCDEITLKMQTLYPHLIVKKDKEINKYYCLTQ